MTDDLRERIIEELAARLQPRSGMSERAVTRLADALLAGPLAPLIAERDAACQALDRVCALRDAWQQQARKWRTIAARNAGPSAAAAALRRALDGDP